MTNEEINAEKAKEFATSYDGKIIGFARIAAMQMAQWKDEQFEKEKKEIDEQWKRLMAESKSIGVDLMQRKDEQFEKENQELRHQIRLIIDAIDHAYLRLDGTYGDLSYEVSDQVKYVKSMQIKELKRK